MVVRDDTARLGRALFYVQQQAHAGANDVVKAQIGTLITAAEAMDLAVRLQGQPSPISDQLVTTFASLAGISRIHLLNMHLPALKRAGVVQYTMSDEKLVGFEEFVGLTAPMLRQSLAVLKGMNPAPVERALLHCVEIASWAPLTQDQHLEQISRRGFSDEESSKALQLSLALGVNRSVTSAILNENVVYNPNVWASGQEGVAKFLRSLPPAERDSLLGLCEQASNKPGLAITAYAGTNPAMIASANKVGLIQSATVKSSAHGSFGSQTYIFSPVLDHIDDAYTTTEALHQRKLFVAHILYGVEKSQRGLGNIAMPLRLVRSLVNRGTVGPASNISTDYHLLEAQGIVNVRDAGGGRAYLDAARKEIIEGGLSWLAAAAPGGFATTESPESVLGKMRPPQAFSTPENDRAATQTSGESDEIATAAVLQLRQLKAEAQRVVRFDFM
jgi:hypothetical protein